MQTEMNELKAKHQDELLALRSELDDTVDEFSTLSYNSRAVRVFDSILHDLLCVIFKPAVELPKYPDLYSLKI